MKIPLLAGILFLFTTITFAQLPTFYLNKKVIKSFNTETKDATLYVVIENEKKPNDAALIDAVKSYWTLNKVKYMSLLEFKEKIKSNSFDNKNIYLFETYNNRSSYLYRPEGYYLTNKPVELLTAVKQKFIPFYLFFSGSALYDNRGGTLKGYYDLMIKNFNYDIRFCQDPANVDSKKKISKYKGLSFLKTESELNNKTFLLVKEQAVKQEKKPVKKNKKKEKIEADENFHLVKDLPKSSLKSVVVFPEDIEYAVKISDKNILLYNGANVYSAEDGSVYATYIRKPDRTRFYVVNAVSLLLSIGLIVYVLNK